MVGVSFELGAFGEDGAMDWPEHAAATRVMTISINAGDSAEGRVVRLQAMLHQVEEGHHKGRALAGG